jgi:hypothetical protein
MIGEILRAILQAGIPVGVTSYALVWWTLKQGYLDQHENQESLRSNLKKMAKSPEGKKVSYNPVHDKWLALGGGFYGIVGLLTYVVVEWRDISQIVFDLGGLMAFIRQFNIDVIINIFIESLLNFITAITWPVYWLSAISAANSWIWIVAAYAGYWAGLKGAQRTIDANAVEHDAGQDSHDPD